MGTTQTSGGRGKKRSKGGRGGVAWLPHGARFNVDTRLLRRLVREWLTAENRAEVARIFAAWLAKVAA